MAILARAGGTGAASSAGSTAVSLGKPSGVVSGDVMIAVVAGNASGATAPTITDNNGAAAWTQVFHNAEASIQTASVWLRVAGASEPATYAWTLSVSVPWAVVIAAYSGVDTTTPQDAAATYDLNLSPSAVSDCPTLTTVTNGAWNILVALSDFGGQTPTSRPAGYTARVGNATNRSIDLADKEITTAGATGAQQFGWGTSDDTQGYQIALRPAGAGGGAQSLIVTASLAPSGSVGRAATLLLAATLTLAGIPARAVAHLTAGALAVAASAAQSVSSLLAASLAPAAAIGRAVEARLAAALSFASALGLPSGFNQALSGALTLAGSLTPSAVGQQISAFMLLEGHPLRGVATNVASILSFAASAVRGGHAILAGTLSSAGATGLIAGLSQAVGGLLGLAGQASGSSVSAILTSSLAATATRARSVGQAVGGGLTLGADTIRGVAATLAGVVGSSSIASIVQGFVHALASALGLAGAASHQATAATRVDEPAIDTLILRAPRIRLPDVLRGLRKRGRRTI